MDRTGMESNTQACHVVGSICGIWDTGARSDGVPVGGGEGEALNPLRAESSDLGRIGPSPRPEYAPAPARSDAPRRQISPALYRHDIVLLARFLHRRSGVVILPPTEMGSYPVSGAFSLPFLVPCSPLLSPHCFDEFSTIAICSVQLITRGKISAISSQCVTEREAVGAARFGREEGGLKAEEATSRVEKGE